MTSFLASEQKCSDPQQGLFLLNLPGTSLTPFQTRRSDRVGRGAELTAGPGGRMVTRSLATAPGRQASARGRAEGPQAGAGWAAAQLPGPPAPGAASEATSHVVMTEAGVASSTRCGANFRGASLQPLHPVSAARAPEAESRIACAPRPPATAPVCPETMPEHLSQGRCLSRSRPSLGCAVCV